MKLLFVAVLVVVVSQFFPSCGGQEQSGAEVVGWVEAKRYDSVDGLFTLVINGHEYVTPEPFWKTVKVGDLVKWDGMTWTIVRTSGSLRTAAASVLLPPSSLRPPSG